MSDLFFWTAGVALGVIGATLMNWALFADRSFGRRRCPKCWYDMRSIEGLRCPECGHVAKKNKLFKTRRRWSWAFTSLAVFALAGFLAIQPKVKRDGWGSVVPATILIFALRLDDNEWAFAALQDRVLPDVSKYDPGATGSALYAWQWRKVANACIDLLGDKPLPADRIELVQWLWLTLGSLDENDARRVHREMISLLSDENAQVRAFAVQSCAHSRFPEDSVKAIRPLLDDANPRVRNSAVTALWILAVGHEPFPTLLEALQHEDWQVRRSVASALKSIVKSGRHQPTPKGTYQALVASYENDAHAEVRAMALSALCKFPADDYIRTALRQALDNSEAVIRAEARWQLAGAQFEPQLVLTAVLSGVTDESASVREPSLWLLENKIPSESLRPHLDWLRSLAASDDEPVRKAARAHLERYGEPPPPPSDDEAAIDDL